MLVLIGPGVDALQDYTPWIDFKTLKITQIQGDTLDTCAFTLHDPASSWTVNAEDDVVVVDETDPTGWPTVNLLANPTFGGAYPGSGVAPSWSGTVVAGVAYSKATPTPAIYGTASQKMALTNVASGNGATVSQLVALSTDETGDAIRVPMCLSAYFRGDAVFAGTGSGPILSIDWLDVNQALLSTSSNSFSFGSGQAGAWYRGVLKATPPANAFYARVKLAFFVGANGLTGNAYWDAAQLEYQTTRLSLVPSPSLLVRNPFMNAADTSANHVNDWWTFPTTGVTYSLLTAPLLNGDHAQGIAIANVANATACFIYQGFTGGFELFVNTRAAYTARMTYQVVTSLSNARAWMQVQCYDALGNFLGSFSARGNTNEPASGGGANNWGQLTVPFGPGTPNQMPAGTAYVQLLGGIETTSATNSGQIAIGQFDCPIQPISLQRNSSACYTTVGAAGLYPTPYCDNLQPGCYTDAVTGFYYRHFRLFAGWARTMEYDYDSEPESNILVNAVDYSVMLQEAPCTLLIKAQADYLAIKAACDYAARQGFLEGLDYVTFVQGISVVDAMLFNWKTTRNVLAEIANHTIAAYWVDYHKRLHYAPALAVSAPFALSDQPNGITTFPMEKWHYTDDSTQSETESVVEGSSELSAPQSFNATGDGATTEFTLNGGQPVNQIDSLTVGGVAKVIGLFSTNQFSDGFDALLDPTNGKLYFAVAPAAAAAIVALYRFLSPVIVRLHWPTTQGKKHSKFVKKRVHGRTILVRRKIHVHHKNSHITSKQAAIDQANANLAQHGQPQPVSTCTIRTPPVPVASSIRPGMAIPITHNLSGLVAGLFQIQKIELLPMGNGQVIRNLEMGRYRPDFMMHLIHVHRQIHESDEDTGSPLLDVLSLEDGWALTDKVTPTVTNLAAWGNPTSSAWDGVAVWG